MLTSLAISESPSSTVMASVNPSSKLINSSYTHSISAVINSTSGSIVVTLPISTPSSLATAAVVIKSASTVMTNTVSLQTTNSSNPFGAFTTSTTPEGSARVLLFKIDREFYLLLVEQ